MKVGRLITMLQEYDEDADFVIELPQFGNDFIVDDIDIDEDGSTVVIKLDKDTY